MYTVNKKTKERNKYNLRELLTKKQQRALGTKPDIIWQLAQRIKKSEADRGNDVAVFADSKISVNGSD